MLPPGTTILRRLVQRDTIRHLEVQLAHLITQEPARDPARVRMLVHDLSTEYRHWREQTARQGLEGLPDTLSRDVSALLWRASQYLYSIQ